MELAFGCAPPLLALLTAFLVDRMTANRGLQPPGFELAWRRGLAMGVVAIAVYPLFLGLVGAGGAPETDFSDIAPARLFVVHLLLLLVLGVWLLLGYAGVRRGERSFPAIAARQVGLTLRRPLTEIGIGVGAYLLIWPAVMAVGVVAWAVIYLLGPRQLLPTEAPAMVLWIASLPVAVRTAIAVSAGVVEEIFFRGFLQPRIGVLLSTVLFVLAHVSYDQPFMLISITFLSLCFAALVVWRQSVWAAVTAHFLFDVVQLLVLIPLVQRMQDGALQPIALGLGGLW